MKNRENILSAGGIWRIAAVLAAVSAAALQLPAQVVVPKGERLADKSRIEEDTVIEELDLDSDISYTVISSATLTIRNVTGGAFTLSASGYGTFVFENIDNKKMSLNVASQTHVKFRAGKRPKVCDGAFFHVDASDESSQTFLSFNGTNFVTRWNDVRGGGRPYAEKNPNNHCKGYPFSVNGRLNGRPVVDFGTIYQSGGLQGAGASLVWSETCSRPMAVFAVIGDTEDSSSNVNGNGGHAYRNNSWFSSTSFTTGYRGNGESGYSCEILNAGSLIHKNAGAEFSVDGAAVDATVFRPSSGSMHVVGWHATKEDYIAVASTKDAPMDAFASERNGELGGIRIAEYIVFTNEVPSEAERIEIISYLTQKWKDAKACDFELSSIRLSSSEGNSSELILSGGAKVFVGSFENAGTVTGNGTVVATEETRPVVTLDADASIHVPDGSVCTVERLADAGYDLVKTGAGKLVINSADAPKASIRVEEGVLEFKALVCGLSDALGKAWFHVDASDSASLTIASDSGGTNYVARWSDVRGEGYPYAEPVEGRPSPFVSAGALNGLSVVDFGTTWNKEKKDGYGATLKWSEKLDRTMEVFVVEQHNDDMKTVIAGAIDKTGPTVRNQTILGNTGDVPTLLTGDPDGHDSVKLFGQNAKIFNDNYVGYLAVDLENKGSAQEAEYYPGYDYHLYHIYMKGQRYLNDTTGTYTVPLDAFACERGNIYGGQRIAECVVYSNLLTDAEREAVNTYLYRKWKNEIVIGELEVASGASVSVPDGSTVRVRILRGAMPTVLGGRIAADLQIGASLIASASASYNPLPSLSAWFHVDASDPDSLVCEERNGVRYVSKWMDVRGGGVYAEQTISKNGDPYIKESALNGLPVMDFGTTWNTDKKDGYGAALKWSRTLERTMEVFVVEQHNDDMKTVIAGATGKTGPTVRNQALVGMYGVSSDYTLLPGDPDGENDSVSVIGASAKIASDSHAGRLCVDLKDKGPAKTSNYHPGYDFHLYNIYAEGSKYLSDGTLTAPLNTFACERGSIYGGQRIAECIVFDRVLDGSERAFVGGLLYAKWFGGSGAQVRYEKAVVPAGVTLDLPYQALELSSGLVIGGSVSAVSVAPASITVTGPEASVCGVLDLGSSGGAIALSGTGWDSLHGGEYRIIGASSVAGAAALWTVSLPDCPMKVAGSPVVRSDGIYVSISRKTFGMRIVVK